MGSIPARPRQECRDLDTRCIDQLGIPGILLMEHASIGTALLIRKLLQLQPASQPRVCIFCGPGNNGGDGYATARHLANAQIPVEVWDFSDPQADPDSDAGVNRRLLKTFQVPVVGIGDRLPPPPQPTLFVDALFGSGLSRPPTGLFAEAIQLLNQHPSPTLALDLPSGLDADRGKPLGPTVKAAWTVTYALSKVGFTNPEGASFTGVVHCVPIGAPLSLLPPQTPAFPPAPHRVEDGHEL